MRSYILINSDCFDTSMALPRGSSLIIIADSGSTKCDWVIVDKKKKKVAKISTKGINPILTSLEEIDTIINSNKELELFRDKIDRVLFYGAGCATEDSKNSIKGILQKNFFEAKRVIVEEDLSAAVYGTTKEPGVICILGTGSNCCYFDGREIHVKQVSLGYSVMDEGSGNYLGRKLLNAFFYNKMPLELHKKFEKKYDLSLDSILKGLYEKENPSAFLASFASFVIENQSEEFMNTIIEKSLIELFDNLIMCYEEEITTKPLHFVGSIAYYLQTKIIKEAEKRNIWIRSFVRRPIDNIILNFNVIESLK